MSNISNPLSISNIAWDIKQDDLVGNLLKNLDVKYIDIAPSKYILNFYKVSKKEIEGVREKWRSYGIEIYGLQSLLYGLYNLNLFSSDCDRKEMLSHLERVCYISEILGARFLTFGSPKNRLTKGQDKKEVLEIALAFFYELGEIAKKRNVQICLEPNPREYGANFLTTTKSTSDFIKELNHPNIKLQFDSGTSILNKEDDFGYLNPEEIGHVHASNPYLSSINKGNGSEIISKIKELRIPRDKVVTIEMLSNNENYLEAIFESITTLKEGT